MPTLRSSDAQLFYEVAGNGPDVVLLHPFPLNHTFWRPVAEQLGIRYRLIMPDLRAHGDSELGNGPATMEKLAGDLAALCRAERITKGFFVGVSVGGYALFEFWRRHREHVAALSGQAAEDLRYLPWRFALSKNYLGHALAQGAMVVDLGKTQVLKGQVAQPLDGLVGRDALFPDLIEQLTEGLGVHTMQTSLYVAPGGAGSSQFPVAGSQ